ncbi:hypothetical protein SCLCIDRAFT_1212502 [Scleroderma citrinum Foug A]|uniref:Uncharacterized protein n=1 Tax=Scleroderma citrinum Foug A TaxID=1036808 RepID=A0A0C3EBI8_9AGAM|nr:hypothetical protein SCLCIDRAFT_1212502 [Scleroderma citrinum Foug A]
MDPSAPRTVGKGVATTSAVCGFLAGVYGALKGHSPVKLSFFSAVNSGIAAATFFSIREYIVGPALTLTHPGKQYQLRRENMKDFVDGISREREMLTWSDIRTSCLLDSAISGAITGGILNTWKRGRAGLVPGLGTGALMCTILQWTVNEFDIFRIAYVSRQTTEFIPATNDTAKRSPIAESSFPSPTHPTSSQPSDGESWKDRVLSVFGRQVSDEVYLKRLKTERDTYLRRIEELEREVHEKPR